MNPYEVVQKTKDVVNKLIADQELVVPKLQAIAKQAAENHPNDQTLRMMHNILERYHQNDKLFITRAEFRDLYHKFATTGNKASAYFKEELALPNDAAKAKRLQYTEDNKDIFAEAMDKAVDKTMLNALNEIWNNDGSLNKKAEYKLYNPDVAKKASDVASLTLTRLGATPKSVSVFAGSKEFIICDAVYDYFKGESHVLIPLEVSASGILIPNAFLTRYGFADLTRENIIKHVADSSGKNILIKAEDLMSTLNNAKKIASMNDMQLQLAIAESRMHANITKVAVDEKSLSLTDNPVFVEMFEEPKQAEFPESPQKESFAAMLSTDAGLAAQLFGERVVEDGRNMIISKLRSFNLSPQVAVASCSDDNIIYAVRLDSGQGPFGFHVLAEISNKKIHIPNLIAAQDKPYEFTKEGISSAMKSSMSDTAMLAKVSPMYDLKPNELMNKLVEAANNKDYKTAEDALNIIAERYSSEMYSKAMNEFMRSLSPAEINKSASEKHSGCNFVVHTANHVGPVCGHLNLPLDQVCQDKYGTCQPKYRQNIENTYEGVLFNTSKVLL